MRAREFLAEPFCCHLKFTPGNVPPSSAPFPPEGRACTCLETATLHTRCVPTRRHRPLTLSGTLPFIDTKIALHRVPCALECHALTSTHFYTNTLPHVHRVRVTGAFSNATISNTHTLIFTLRAHNPLLCDNADFPQEDLEP